MNKIKTSLVAIALALGVTMVGVMVPATSYAVDPGAEIQKGVKGAGGDPAGQPTLQDQIKSIVNLLLYVLGVVAVIVIVISGIKYATSDGDSGKITSAKNTILYAVIGLVVAILAYAIVNFVIDAF